MSERHNPFPSQFTLNGADYFLLQLDRIMLRSSGKNNVCTLVVTLQQRLELDDLKRYLSDKPVYQWVSKLRLKKGLPFTLIKWVVDAKGDVAEIQQHQLEENQNVPDNLLATTINVINQAPFKIDLLQRSKTGTVLIFTWHHAFMDAHGGESLAHFLGSQLTSKQPEWLHQQKINLPLKQRALIAQDMKNYLHEVSKLPLLSLYKKQSAKPSLHYQLLSFNETQSQLISNRARQHGAGISLSNFYLAATACAVAFIHQQRGTLEGDVLVPVPLDRRRRGSDDPIIGNQVSFLFYRIPKKALSDLQNCTTELINQMRNLMRDNNPEHGLVMMDFMRRNPGLIYRLMLEAPTAGLMASFFYSDTGESLQKYDELFGCPVESAVHYPPTMYPPGMTFVFSRFRGCLQLSFGYMEQVINDKEVEQLFNQLRSLLLGEASE
jgi:NRPS condensation-like uncharacterized protein